MLPARAWTVEISPEYIDDRQNWTTGNALTNLSGTCGDDTLTLESGTLLLTIENSQALLPGTGGVGTTMFYVAGGLLIAGAAVLIIAKNKKKTA